MHPARSSSRRAVTIAALVRLASGPIHSPSCLAVPSTTQSQCRRVANWRSPRRAHWADGDNAFHLADCRKVSSSTGCMFGSRAVSTRRRGVLARWMVGRRSPPRRAEAHLNPISGHQHHPVERFHAGAGRRRVPCGPATGPPRDTRGASMRRHKATIGMLVIAVPLAPLAGCSDLPGTDEQQGAVAGGVGGAVLGAAVAKNKLLGGLIGGAIGAVGGYLIGANWDKLTGNERDEAIESVRNAESNPATAEQARRATTADINSDGFVTLDEVVAMEKAGFSDDE